MNNIKIENYTKNTAEWIDILVSLDAIIFDSPFSREEILKELESRKDLLGLIAYDENNTPCGFAVGFQHSPKVFYNWIFGVDPNFRKLGIGKALLEKQNEIAKELGYKSIRATTRNKFKNMLILSIKLGFEITGVQKKIDSDELSIILEKKL